MRLEREAQLERRAKYLGARVAELPDGEARSALEASSKRVEAELARLGPLAKNAALKMKTRLETKPACRAELGGIRAERLQSILVAIESSAASARNGVVQLLSRHGDWSHVPLLMTVLWDEDVKVRASTRAALRKIVGHDMRLPGGFVWDFFYARSFGKLPQSRYPVAVKQMIPKVTQPPRTL